MNAEQSGLSVYSKDQIFKMLFVREQRPLKEASCSGLQEWRVFSEALLVLISPTGLLKTGSRSWHTFTRLCLKLAGLRSSQLPFSLMLSMSFVGLDIMEVSLIWSQLCPHQVGQSLINVILLIYCNFINISSAEIEKSNQYHHLSREMRKGALGAGYIF